MEVVIVTVGEEVLAGDVEDSNATWLGRQFAERGVAVRRMLTLPDEREVIARHVADYSAGFDAVVVTGGIGSTPDDVTMEAVADAFDVEMAVDRAALADVEETLTAIADRVPQLDVDPVAEASIPASARPILNPEGLAPACVVENVYVLPGIPREMRATFGEVADEFQGATAATTLYTTAPEANITADLAAIQADLPVSIGCYPDRDAGHNRLKVVSADEDARDNAATMLRERVDASDDPVERDWTAAEESDSSSG